MIGKGAAVMLLVSLSEWSLGWEDKNDKKASGLSLSRIVSASTSAVISRPATSKTIQEVKAQVVSKPWPANLQIVQECHNGARALLGNYVF